MRSFTTARWTLTCTAGHVTRVRAETRPLTCECGALLLEGEYIAPGVSGGKQPSRGRRRPSGPAALFTKGDGRAR
jgi:hypothetical protein